MKILYITPKANDYGGVAKILSVKASALAQNHQVFIATQNDGWQNAPYEYNASIQFFDMVLYGSIPNICSSGVVANFVSTLLAMKKKKKIIKSQNGAIGLTYYSNMISLRLQLP